MRVENIQKISILYIFIYYLSLFGNFDLSISEPDLQKIYKLILHYLQYLM